MGTRNFENFCENKARDLNFFCMDDETFLDFLENKYRKEPNWFVKISTKKRKVIAKYASVEQLGVITKLVIRNSFADNFFTIMNDVSDEFLKSFFENMDPEKFLKSNIRGKFTSPTLNEAKSYPEIILNSLILHQPSGDWIINPIENDTKLRFNNKTYDISSIDRLMGVDTILKLSEIEKLIDMDDNSYWNLKASTAPIYTIDCVNYNEIDPEEFKKFVQKIEKIECNSNEDKKFFYKMHNFFKEESFEDIQFFYTTHENGFAGIDHLHPISLSILYKGTKGCRNKEEKNDNTEEKTSNPDPWYYKELFEDDATFYVKTDTCKFNEIIFNGKNYLVKDLIVIIPTNSDKFTRDIIMEMITLIKESTCQDPNDPSSVHVFDIDKTHASLTMLIEACHDQG